MSPLLLRVAVAAVAGTLFAVVMSAGGVKPVPCADVDVDPATWQVERQRSLLSRSPTGAEELASELVRCHRLLGLRSARVRRLLGHPDRRGTTSWLYQLALNRGILSQPDYLRLAFDPEDVVTRAQIVPPG